MAYRTPDQADLPQDSPADFLIRQRHTHGSVGGSIGSPMRIPAEQRDLDAKQERMELLEQAKQALYEDTLQWLRKEAESLEEDDWMYVDTDGKDCGEGLASLVDA